MKPRAIFNRLFSRPCPECAEVRVYFWLRCCAFCDPGEGRVSEVKQ
jgi:hypothetical protein